VKTDSIFSFMCMFYRSLFVLLSFFYCPLGCLLFFEIRILITHLYKMYDVNIVLKTLSNICAKNCSVFVTNDELKMPNGQSEEFEDTKEVIRIRISKMNR
jgi:hypothetical protein